MTYFYKQNNSIFRKVGKIKQIIKAARQRLKNKGESLKKRLQPDMPAHERNVTQYLRTFYIGNF